MELIDRMERYMYDIELESILKKTQKVRSILQNIASTQIHAYEKYYETLK